VQFWNKATSGNYLTPVKSGVGIRVDGTSLFNNGVSVSPTWNNSSTTYQGLLVNTTNTASHAGSMLADFRVGGVSRASIDANGTIYSSPVDGSRTFFQLSDNYGAGYIYGGAQFAFQPAAAAGIQFYMVYSGQFWAGQSLTVGGAQSSPNASLFAASANILEQYNGTSSQEQRLYGSRVSSTNYERFVIRTGSTGTNTILATEKGSGGGAACGMSLRVNGADAITIDVNQNVAFSGHVQLGNNAITGLSAGALAATTNASIVMYDASGQAYRIPCII
jgi:hypothetical protein